VHGIGCCLKFDLAVGIKLVRLLNFVNAITAAFGKFQTYINKNLIKRSTVSDKAAGTLTFSNQDTRLSD